MRRSTARLGTYLLFFPVSIFYMELVLKLACFDGAKGRSLFFTLLFSLSAGAVLALLASCFGRRVNRVLGTVLTLLLTLLFFIQTVYYQVFSTFTTLVSATAGAGKIWQFWREALTGVRAALPYLLLLAVPVAVWLLAVRDYAPRRRAGRGVVAGLLLLAAGSYIIGAGAVNLSGRSEITPPGYFYNESFQPDQSVAAFGLVTTLRLDLKNILFGMEEKVQPENPTDGDAAGSETSPGGSGGETPEHTPIPEPIVYADNVMDIDFDALIAGETDETVRGMHEYFSTVAPTKQNEYTGMFKGKNLIWLCAEGFSTLAVHEQLTPTLYKLANEGFVCRNFYNPIWSVSTSDGEYTTCTSLVPKSGVWSFFQSSKIGMPFTFGHQFGAQGYAVNACHNHTYDYYRRDVSHPNMGYTYKGVGNGLEMDKRWPRSDLDMMEITIPEYIDSRPFHTYYMTVSGHLNYNFMGNSMAYKHREAVADLPYSEGPRAYIACNMELDAALAYLIEQLETKGILEDTVIALSGDHYPYGLTEAETSELLGHTVETGFELYKSTLILWCADMEEPIYIDKPCCPLDVMPTLSNLFGLTYDSRLLMGRDILSDSPGLIIFKNRSWISDLGRYNATEGTFTPNEGAEIPEDYAKTISAQVKNKFNFSAKILENDYYTEVLKGLRASPEENPAAPAAAAAAGQGDAP